MVNALEQHAALASVPVSPALEPLRQKRLERSLFLEQEDVGRAEVYGVSTVIMEPSTCSARIAFRLSRVTLSDSLCQKNTLFSRVDC